MLHSVALLHTAHSHDLSESLAITIVPPKGAKGASYASGGKDNGGYSRDRSARLPFGRRAHVAAERLAITIVPPKGAKGASYASGGKDKGGYSRDRSARLPFGRRAYVATEPMAAPRR